MKSIYLEKATGTYTSDVHHLMVDLHNDSEGVWHMDIEDIIDDIKKQVEECEYQLRHGMNKSVIVDALRNNASSKQNIVGVLYKACAMGKEQIEYIMEIQNKYPNDPRIKSLLDRHGESYLRLLDMFAFAENY